MIFRVLSSITFFTGVIMLIPLFVAFFYGDQSLSAFATISVATIIISIILFKQNKVRDNRIGKREGYIIVVFSWIVIGVMSALPYYFAIGTLSPVSSLFESFSGLTTTGATIFSDIEALPQSILMWRSLTQWIGGMGIIVLTVAVFPLLGIGGVELFVAESPGPTNNKIHPRIKETAKRLWLLYVVLTAVLIVILKVEGMIWFDAINHGLTTMATGGFSTKNASIAHYDSALIQYTLILFMFVAGINYTLIYAGIKGRFYKFWQSDEFMVYIGFVLFSSLFISLLIFNNTDSGIEESIRQASFQVVSLITTTGFVSADYTSWHPTGTIFFFCLLFSGACAGSTAGGIKIIRHFVFAKNSFLEFKRLLHPEALIRVSVDNVIVRGKIITHILVFLLVYLFIFLIGTFIMSFILADFDQPLLSSMGAVATSLGNVGPSIGDLGPMDNFAHIPDTGKGILALIMLIGRLELFSVLILFTPYFWKDN